MSSWNSKKVGKQGRSFIRLLLPCAALLLPSVALLLASCGRHDAAYVPYPESPTKGKVWQDIAPIIAQSCGGKACHSQGSRHGVYVDDKEAFIKDKKIVYRSIFVTGTMPKNSQLTTRELAAIERFFQNH